jgi:hypothetical protein
MSAPDIPTEYTIHIENVDNDLLSNIRIMEVQPVTLQGGTTAIKTESKMEGGTNPIKTESKLEGGTNPLKTESKIEGGANPIKTDSSISVMKLPQIDLQFGMRPTRVHMPVGLKFCVSLLGMPLVSFDVCGESMVIVEDYTPHRTELCA